MQEQMKLFSETAVKMQLPLLVVPVGNDGKKRIVKVEKKNISVRIRCQCLCRVRGALSGSLFRRKMLLPLIARS